MDDQKLDYLLARGRLSGSQKEQVLDAVQGTTAREAQQPARRRAWLWAFSGAVATLILVPVVLLTTSEPDGFRARGGASERVLLEAGCSADCHLGDTLMFRVGGTEKPGYLAAFAVGPGGERIWYFPSDQGELLEVAATDEPVVLKRGVRLGPEHQAGTIELHFALLREPMSREQLDAALNKGLATVEQKLEIHP